MRIVSLCPSMTELLFRLGCVQHVVGRTRFCVSPQPEVDSIPRVGGTKDPRITQIVSLAPDLVIFNEEENRREDYDALISQGIRCLIFYPRTIDETLLMIKTLGEQLDCTKASEVMIARITQAQVSAREALHASTRERVPSYAYLIWRKPYMTLNADTYISAILSAGGARNVFAESSVRYPSIELQELMQANPDYILLSSEPFPFEDKHLEQMCQETGWSSERFKLVDGAVLSWHGSRTEEGIRYAQSLFTS